MRGRMPGAAGAMAVMRSPSGGWRLARCAVASGEVRARNTSSRLGRRSVTTPSAPDSSRTSSARRRSDTVPSVGTSRSSSPCSSCSSTVSPPMRALSCRGGAGRDDAAAVEHRDAVGELVGLLEVLRREEHGRARVGERADDVPQLAPAAGVESRRRLVEEEDLGRDDEAEREVEAAAHAAGVGADALGRGIRQPEALEQLRGARLRGASATRPDSRPSITRFSTPVRTSSTAADWPVRLIRCLTSSGSRSDVDAGDGGGARVGAGERREHVDGRRLAGAVGSEQGEDLAAEDLEVETVEDDLASEGLSQAPDVRWLAASRHPSRSVYGRNCL